MSMSGNIAYHRMSFQRSTKFEGRSRMFHSVLDSDPHHLEFSSSADPILNIFTACTVLAV